LNLCKTNTCLNWTNYSVLKGFGLDSFYCTTVYKHYRNTWSLCPTTNTCPVCLSLSVCIAILCPFSTDIQNISFYDKQYCPCISIFFLLFNYFCIEYVNHDIAETKTIFRIFLEIDKTLIFSNILNESWWMHNGLYVTKCIL